MPFLMAEAEATKVADRDRDPIAARHDDVAKVVEITHQADAADHEALLATGEARPAGIGGVVVDGGNDVVHRNAEALQLNRVEVEPELFCEATEIIDGRNARHCLQRRYDDPALNLRQLHQVLAVGLQGVTVNLPGRPGDRVKAGLVDRWQVRSCNAFEHPLAREI